MRNNFHTLKWKQTFYTMNEILDENFSYTLYIFSDLKHTATNKNVKTEEIRKWRW